METTEKTIDELAVELKELVDGFCEKYQVNFQIVNKPEIVISPRQKVEEKKEETVEAA